MGQRLTFTHPLMKTSISVTQSDTDPSTWNLSARGHTSHPFQAASPAEALQKGPTLVGFLRRTEESVKKLEARRAKKAASAEQKPAAPKLANQPQRKTG